jgi:hypothetical protein
MTRTAEQITAILNADTDGTILAETWGWDEVDQAATGDSNERIVLTTGEVLVVAGRKWVVAGPITKWVDEQGYVWGLDEWADHATEHGITWHIRLDGQAVVEGEAWSGGQTLLEPAR